MNTDLMNTDLMNTDLMNTGLMGIDVRGLAVTSLDLTGRADGWAIGGVLTLLFAALARWVRGVTNGGAH
jgi:hypothetical protein